MVFVCDKTVTHCNALQHTATDWQEGFSYGIRLQHTVTHCYTLQHNATGWPEGSLPPCALILTRHYYVVYAHMQHHYVTEDSNQHDYTVERHNNITIVLNTHITLTFSRNISDSGTSGPTGHFPGPGTVLVGGAKTHLGDTGMRHSTTRGSVPVFRTSSQRGLFKYLEKVCVEIHVTQERWGRPHL